MPKFTRNFTSGKMNKDLDERLVPNGEYIDAQNIRVNSTESGDRGVIENALGNTQLTQLSFNGVALSTNARAIGTIADSARETIYWMIHDPNFSVGATGKMDMIVSYNTLTNNLRYHVVSMNDGGGVLTTLNFNPKYLINGINIVDDLLFFTDGINPPRVINVKRDYTVPATNIDTFKPEEILVIKKPPTVPMVVTPLVTPGEQNFMEERFICFGYRYRYEDGEYSATTPFSNPLFQPRPFNFSIESFLNEGMVNVANACRLDYFTGDETVVGIDLLFKEAGKNIINVIKKIDKATLGVQSNITESYTFTMSEIYTILPDSELLRLYDNVPRFAFAQTIMGNRLVYGNYVEGYDLLDRNDQPVKIEYDVELQTREIGTQNITTALDDVTYTIDGTEVIPDSLVGIDLTDVVGDLREGSAININLTFRHNKFTGSGVTPSAQTGEITLDFNYFLTRAYSSVFDLATSPEFQNAVGTAANIQPVLTYCDGFTFTDIFNCNLPNNLGTFEKTGSGIDAVDEGIAVFAAPGSNVIGLGLVAMQYTDTGATTDVAYEYYEIVSASALFQKDANPTSLHSNRGYEVGIVYMDEFLRATTVLTSPNNVAFVPCSASADQNFLRITIPPDNIAPAWAKFYKFVIKADREGYDTIYSNIFFRDGVTNDAYFLLEGENARKVEAGMRLIVKADTTGALGRCAYCTILEKEVQEAGFNGFSNAPAGVYVKINPNSFSVIEQEGDTYTRGLLTETVFDPLRQEFPILGYFVSIPDPSNPGKFMNYPIPAGSRIRLSFDFERIGTGNCPKRTYRFTDRDFVSRADYIGFKEWWDGEGIGDVINTGFSEGGYGAEYIPTFATNRQDIPTDFGRVFFRFYLSPVSNALVLLMSGINSCSGITYPSRRQSTIRASIFIRSASSAIIWETEPQDTQPDVFYEGSQIFEINSQGEHQGNVQNQTSLLPAIIDSNFHNCYSFGNGAESYKIRDSIVGKEFNLGNRVTSVSAQDYKEAYRFSDLTYSGIYNNESNVNKLNEFNLGLLNFKPLERSFGMITLIDGRETDIRVIQEDKISYVLAGKNLLSDAAAGGVITSVPEVLGTQIARIEEYGSTNAESYVKWGNNSFFADIKRGAVLMLSGRSQGEALTVISDQGMSTWFRDMFVASYNTQKLGGFDPYMKEYVMTSNEILKPADEECISCGTSLVYRLNPVTPITYCVNLGNLVGDVTISYRKLSDIGTFRIDAVYDGNTFTTGNQTGTGTLVIPKDKISVNTIEITLNGVGEESVVEVVVGCPDPVEINVIQITLSNNENGGEFIHNQYSYTDGVYASPLQSTQVQLTTGSTFPLVSQYNSVTGAQGFGSIPANGSTVRMVSNRLGGDSFVFNPAVNKFRYLRTDTVYANTEADMIALLAAATIATPITGADPTYNAEFTMPATGDNLYMIWDYRMPYEIEMCYDTVESRGLCCCGCQPEE